MSIHEDQKVGADLAGQVAKRLRMKCDLVYSHRDYCGTGLTWHSGEFIYGHVYDGFIHEAIRTFNQQSDFIQWLSDQSNKSLQGSEEDLFYRGNQRLTIERLQAFISGPPKPRYEK